MKIHHIGYLVENIEAAKNEFLNIGCQLKNAIIYDEERKIDACLMENEGFLIELLSPRKNSQFYGLTIKYKNSPYHICYQVDNLEMTIRSLRDKGYLLLKEPQTAILFINKKIAFLINSEIGIIELLEK
jgi:methylmalonyl-CoA/ethylmalonyl-CoA epimerase